MPSETAAGPHAAQMARGHAQGRNREEVCGGAELQALQPPIQAGTQLGRTD